MEINPNMDVSIMNKEELMLSHLYSHYSFSLSEPTFGKDSISLFHSNLIKEFKKIDINHYNVDSLDKAYK